MKFTSLEFAINQYKKVACKGLIMELTHTLFFLKTIYFLIVKSKVSYAANTPGMPIQKVLAHSDPPCVYNNIILQ